MVIYCPGCGTYSTVELKGLHKVVEKALLTSRDLAAGEAKQFQVVKRTLNDQEDWWW
jgi:hypothetical protein